MIITIDNKKYDISQFINEHPGGREVFKNNTDLTDEFYKVNHSEDAIKMMEKYLIIDEKNTNKENTKENTPNVNEINIHDISLQDFLYKKITSCKILNNIKKKLFTHEDYLSMHKKLGALVLINVIYTIFDLYKGGCNGVLTMRKIGWEFFIFLIIHLFLSLSSLQFHVPNNSNFYTNISIGQEYRLHSIIFVIRHVIIIFILYFLNNNLYSQILIPIVVLLNMYFADLVSYFYKPKEDSLGYKIGSLPFWSGCSKQLQSIISTLYTFAQIYITYLLVSSNSNIEINLFAIFIIQITAFMGTLSKKGFINNFHWHFIYLFQYVVTFLLFFNHKNIFTIQNLIIGLIIWALRTKLSVNKFSLWTLVSILILISKYFKSNTLIILVAVILYNIFNYFGVFFDKKREINHNIIKQNKKTDDANLHEIKIKMKQKTDYNPGQYYNLYIDKEKRPYTPIHIDKNENVVTFFIKDYKNNKISEKICNLSEESYIHVNGPFGSNFYDKNNDKIIYNNNEINTKNIVMFYCGTGITPFYSILKNLNKNTKYFFKIIGSLKNENENILNDIKQTIFYSTNKLTSKKIKKIIKKYNPLDTTILLCGSESYNNFVSENITKEFNVCKW